MTNKQTKPCPYCLAGITPAGFDCVDCHGTGVRCILCGLPSASCDCAESAFDRIEQQRAIDQGEQY